MPDSDRPSNHPLTVYAAIGNSDDRLTQARWSRYVFGFLALVRFYAAVVHGEWFSSPYSTFQNACTCFEIDRDKVTHLRADLRELRSSYEQDSVAWTVAYPTEFI